MDPYVFTISHVYSANCILRIFLYGGACKHALYSVHMYWVVRSVRHSLYKHMYYPYMNEKDNIYNNCHNSKEG